jgi:lysophospholipase L1-like esterase
MGNAEHRGRLWLCIVLLLLTPSLALQTAPTALAASGPSQQANHVPFSLTYYALGDSVASGYGLMDDNPDPCHRSIEASYPALVQQSLENDIPIVHFSLLACSGASFNHTTAQIGQCWDSAPARYVENCRLQQINEQFLELRSALSQRSPGSPALVSLTVGIDDLDWTDPSVMMDLMSTSDDDFVTSMDQLSQTTAANLRTQIDALLSDYPNVKVVVTGYYNPFNQDSWILRYANLLKSVSPVISPVASLAQSLNEHVLHGKGSVKPLVTGLGWIISQIGRQPNTIIPSDDLCTSAIQKGRTLSCYERTEHAITTFNATLNQVVTDEAGAFPGRIAFASVSDDFREHASPQPLCGAAAPAAPDSWIQYPDEENINSPIPDVEQPLLYPAKYGDCFHPNYDGAGAYARAVVRAAQTLGY